MGLGGVSGVTPESSTSPGMVLASATHCESVGGAPLNHLAILPAMEAVERLVASAAAAAVSARLGLGPACGSMSPS
eukprot:2438522-Alexandrium_andersonii.AAC.1